MNTEEKTFHLMQRLFVQRNQKCQPNEIHGYWYTVFIIMSSTSIYKLYYEIELHMGLISTSNLYLHPLYSKNYSMESPSISWISENSVCTTYL